MHMTIWTIRHRGLPDDDRIWGRYESEAEAREAAAAFPTSRYGPLMWPETGEWEVVRFEIRPPVPFPRPQSKAALEAETAI